MDRSWEGRPKGQEILDRFWRPLFFKVYIIFSLFKMGDRVHRIVFQELEHLDVESLRLLAARYGVESDVESIRDMLVRDIAHAGMDRGKTTGTRRRNVDPDDCDTVETCGKRLLMLANNYNDHLLTKFRDFVGKVRQRGLKVTDVVNYSIENHTTVLYKAVDVSPIADESLIRWVSPVEKVRLLLDNGASKQVSPFAVSYALKGALDDPKWWKVTCPALMNQRVEIVRLLLEKGFDAEGFIHDKVKSPLFIACEIGNKPLVNLLLRRNASIFRVYVPNTDSSATFEGTDGKQYVFRFNQDALLVEEKHNPFLAEYNPITISLLCDNMEIFFQLVAKHNEMFQDPDTDAEYKQDILVHNREIILSYAVILDDLSTVKRLVEEYGFDVNQHEDNVNTTDTNSLFQAALSNSKEILEYLLSKGADPYQAYIGDSSDDNEWINSSIRGTPLWIACLYRFQWIQADLDTIRILLDHDEDPRMVKIIDTILRFLELIVTDMERDKPLERQQKQIYTSITTMLKDKRETLVNPVVTFEVTPTTPTERVEFIKENCPDDVTVDSKTGEVEIGHDPISYEDLVDIEPANLLPIGKPLGGSADDYVNDSQGKHCFSRDSLAGEVANEHIRPLKNTHTSTSFKEHEKAKIKEFLRRRPVFKGMETATTVVAEVSIRSRISSKIPNGQGLPYINENAMLGLTKQGVVDLADYLSELSEGAVNFDLDAFESAESDLHAVESFVDQVNAHPESSSIWTYISANPVLHPEDE